MEPNELLSTVPRETASMVAAAGTAGLDAPVASCPGWDVARVLGHLGSIHRWVAQVIATGDKDVARPEGERPTGRDLLGWMQAGAEQLVAVGTEMGPNAPATNWADVEPTTAFWFRRMANETAVHSWDVRAAAGHPEPIEAELAVDAIDEWLTVMAPLRRPEGLSGTVHVQCTDIVGDWTVDLTSFATERRGTDADAVLRGSASGILLRLLNRSDDGEVLGDPAILARWSENVRF